MKPTRIGFLSDLHHGSPQGLTLSPQSRAQGQLKERFEDALKWAGPLDILIATGDLTHGTSEWDHDLDNDKLTLPPQLEGAIEILLAVNAKEYLLTSGTPIHEGGGMVSTAQILAWALRLAGKKASFYHQLRLTVNRWYRIQARHKATGRTKLPYGHFTAPKRQQVWGLLNSVLEASLGGDRARWAHFMAYGHVHLFSEATDAYGTVVTLPCWQMAGGVYGDAQCEGHVDVGMYYLEVPQCEGGDVIRRHRLYPVAQAQRWVSR